MCNHAEAYSTQYFPTQFNQKLTKWVWHRLGTGFEFVVDHGGIKGEISFQAANEMCYFNHFTGQNSKQIIVIDCSNI